ncbi:MAG: D-alanine--D-alanine ligase [Pseudomonadota bacterium]
MKPRVLVLYNEPFHLDEPSETDVVNEVGDVQAALEAVGWAVEPVPVSGARLAGVFDRLVSLRDRVVVFNLTEGLDGEARHEPVVSGLLELYGIRYTGSGPMAMAWALDKSVAQAILAQAGVPTAPSALFRGVPDDATCAALDYPRVLKPAREDGSLGITADSFVDSPARLRARVAALLEEFRQPVLAEAYLPGREFNVAVIGEGPGATALPVAEMEFVGYADGEPRMVTHGAKWASGSEDDLRTVPRCPARLTPDLAARIAALVVTGYRAFGCRDYARLDLRLDAAGEPRVIDVNPNPDISRSAGLARAVAASGRSYEEFIGSLVEAAWTRSH